jgi:hypothetical protein
MKLRWEFLNLTNGEKLMLVRKISTRTVFGSVADIQELVLPKENRDKVIPLFRVWGLCTGTRKGQMSDEQIAKQQQQNPQSGGNAKRDWTALLGSFTAINLKTGERFTSGVLFLPDYVADLVAGKLFVTEDGDTPPVEFAFDVGAQFKEGNPTSYEYVAAELLETGENDPLALMEKSLPQIAGVPQKQIEQKAKS